MDDNSTTTYQNCCDQSRFKYIIRTKEQKLLVNNSGSYIEANWSLAFDMRIFHTSQIHHLGLKDIG